MKKSLISALLCGVLCLSLSACGTTPPPTPSHSPSDAPVAVTPPVLSEPSGVFTDWSKLTAYTPAEAVGTRLSDGPLDTLTTGDYGLLLPYQGESLLVADGWEAGQRVGLVTVDGCVVLDPICDRIYQASYYDYNASPSVIYPGIYILSRAEDNPNYTDEWDIKISRYAVCALDGSWCTDFIYESVYSAPDGVVCVEDHEKNHAVYLDKNGNVLADTRSWEVLPRLEPHNTYNFTSFHDGFALVRLLRGGIVFISMDGRILETEHGEPFDSAHGFHEGHAAVEVDGLWGFIDESGNWTIEPRFAEEPDVFLNGQAVVRKFSGGSYIINTEGETLWESEYDLWPQPDGNGSYLYNAYTSDGDACWFTFDMQPITFPEGIDSRTLSYSTGLGFVCSTRDGAWVISDNDTTFYPDAESVTGTSDLRFIWYEDNSQEIRNAAGDILHTTENGYFYTVTDAVTQETYLAMTNNVGTNSIYSENGERLVTDWNYGMPMNGLFNCQDAVSIGYKNLNNEWVFCLPIDSGD
ncbi:MAG: WG repeat-containing protein [Eubacteriales bacterium]|nr:WG repeat-containing protein [Eubacteriales bacterium]